MQAHEYIAIFGVVYYIVLFVVLKLKKKRKWGENPK